MTPTDWVLRPLAVSADPLVVFAPFAGKDGAVLLDSAAEAGGRGRWSYLCVAPCSLWQDTAQETKQEQDPFAVLRTLAAQMAAWGTPPRGNAQDTPPFCGGVVGWLSYEAGRHLERLPQPIPDDVGVPDAAFGLYDAILAFDHLNGVVWVCAAPGQTAKADWLTDCVMQAACSSQDAPVSQMAFTLYPEQSRQQAEHAIAAAIAAIWAGDIFQANVTQRFSGQMPEDLPIFDLYRRLRLASAAPFAACATFGGAHLLSASPERFLAVSPHGQVETRPIKGTRRRGSSVADDAAQAAALQASPKDRAENLMIVDLLRNDLSRVCTVGSVRVPVLCGLETFASVHHLVSVVTGTLPSGTNAIDLLMACFPGGSITGAPKIHAMEILRDLEPCRRGLYCGSLLWFGADGAFDSSILIRSLVVGRSGKVVAQAGGGIVSDSDPTAEWAEAMVKVAPLLRAACNDPPLIPTNKGPESKA